MMGRTVFRQRPSTSDSPGAVSFWCLAAGIKITQLCGPGRRELPKVLVRDLARRTGVVQPGGYSRGQSSNSDGLQSTSHSCGQPQEATIQLLCWIG